MCFLSHFVSSKAQLPVLLTLRRLERGAELRWWFPRNANPISTQGVVDDHCWWFLPTIAIYWLCSYCHHSCSVLILNHQLWLSMSPSKRHSLLTPLQIRSSTELPSSWWCWTIQSLDLQGPWGLWGATRSRGICEVMGTAQAPRGRSSAGSSRPSNRWRYPGRHAAADLNELLPNMSFAYLCSMNLHMYTCFYIF